MNNGDIVTWEAIHFGIRQKLEVKIVEFNRPISFTDAQISGVFHSFSHQHFFESKGTGTLIKDLFKFKCPFGYLGYLAADKIIEIYLKEFLVQRNKTIKKIAESDEWRSVL
jgi:ligand-binding SRPBCC domain-containing protein